MRKIISIVLSFGLLFQQGGLLYAAGQLNLANYLSQARNAIVQPDVFQPARLRYISYDIKSNDFKLLLDKGGAKLNKLSNSQTPKLNNATQELFNYFLIGLSLPNDTFWVNLRPDAPENIIDPLLEKTDIGKIFLEADLQLKKDTASLTSPQNPEGKAYWDKLYKKAGELFGTENITIPTITRPWIVPNEVIVRETDDSAYIYKATLKVMLEQDHLKDSVAYNFSDPRLKELNEYSSQIIRETIIPKLTKEVNSSKRYAQLRQVYYSLVLSRWFKQKYSSPGSAGASANSYLSLIDSGNLANLASKESYDKQTYFQAYQKSFKDGEYNLKETVATPFGQSIRSYISGGISVNKYDIGRFRVGAESDKVYKALTSGSPILNLWGLFNKKNETKNPIKILYDGYKKSKDNDEPDVVADRMLNVIFHFNGGIDKKDIQKIIELLEKAGKIKLYFYKTILTIFNEAVKNWDDKSSIVEVRDRIRVVLDTFVIDKGEEIIKFINDFLSRNKNKKDGFVQELQEYINNKKKRGYDDYVVMANSLHYKRHQLEKSSELHDGQAGRKLHNFMTEISLFQGYDVVKYDKIVLEELTGISPTVDDMLIADFILNYSKLLFAGSPLEVRELIGKDMEGIADGLKAMNMIVRGFADYQEHNSKMGNLSTCLRDAQLVVNRIKRIVKPGQQDGISIAIILDTLNNLKEKLVEVEQEIKTLISLIAPEIGTELSADLSSLLQGSHNISNRVEILYRKLQTSAGVPLTRLGDFLSALESESNNIYNEEAKNAISRLINTIKQQIELINEGKYHLVTREVGKSIIEGDWKYLCSQMPGIEKTLVTKYNDVIKALVSYSKAAGSPVGKAIDVMRVFSDIQARFYSLPRHLPHKDAALEVINNKVEVITIELEAWKSFVFKETFGEVKFREMLSNSIENLKKEESGVVDDDVMRILKDAIDMLREIEQSLDAGSPVGVALPGVNGENGEPLRYVSTEDLIKGGKLESLRSAVAQMTFSADEASKVDKNRRFAVEIDPQGKITVWGILIYNEETQAVSRIILPNGLSDIKLTEEKNKNLSDALIQAWKEEVRINTAYVGSPVVGKKLMVYDENTAKNVELRYVTYKELAIFNKEMIKERLQAEVFGSKINMDGKEYGNRREPISHSFPVVSDKMLEGIHFAVKIEGDKLKSIKGIVYNDGKEIIFYGETAYIAKAILDVWKKEGGVSSAVVLGQVHQKPGQWGGIDLTDRALHIKLERVGSFASTPLLLPQVKNVQDLDLDKEFEQVEALASSGIVPNSHRLLELFTVCHYRGEFGERLNQIISCLKAASAIQEAEAIDSDEDFRLALMMPEMLS